MFVDRNSVSERLIKRSKYKNKECIKRRIKNGSGVNGSHTDTLPGKNWNYN